MPRITREEARDILRRRPIFTKELNDARGALTRLFENDHRDRVREPYFYGGAYENRTQDVLELDYLDWYGLHRVPGLVKRVNACKQEQDPALGAMRAFLADWVDDAALLADAKKNVTKGRRPVSDSDRKTPPRTLENTGTCPVCGRNVKLLHGRIVDHGFEIQLGMRRGRCFGVDYHPWEKCPDGKIDYAEAVRQTIKRVREDIEYMQMEPDADPKSVQRDLAIAESELRFATKTLALLEEEIRNWTAQPLPGEKS